MNTKIAIVIKVADVTQDGQRYTQIIPGEAVAVVHRGNSQSGKVWVRKADSVEGWTDLSSLREAPELQSAQWSPRKMLTFGELQSQFLKTPYLSAGLSPDGIDCSGLMQIYLWQVHGIPAPRNSREQRRLALERSFNTVRGGDLIFAVEKSNGAHHVGLYLSGSIWHSDRNAGVILQALKDFEAVYHIEAVASINRT